MENEIDKCKLKIQDIINEIDDLKKYNTNLLNNSKGEKLENYLNNLNQSIINAQDIAEDIYIKNFK